MDELQRIIDQLDKDQPNWYIDWANQSELTDFAKDMADERPGDPIGRLKRSVGRRLFHRIINAALSAGLIGTVD